MYVVECQRCLTRSCHASTFSELQLPVEGNQVPLPRGRYGTILDSFTLSGRYDPRASFRRQHIPNTTLNTTLPALHNLLHIPKQPHKHHTNTTPPHLKHCTTSHNLTQPPQKHHTTSQIPPHLT